VVAAPWVAWAVVRLGGLERGHPLTAMIAGTPYAAASGWLPLLVAAGLRRWIVLAVAALAWAGLVAAVAPRAVGGATDRDGERLVVMTANLKYGEGDARRVLELVDRHDVDVLSLQELTPEGVRRLDAAGARRRLPGRVLEALPSAAGSGLMARRPLRRVATGPQGAGAAQPEAALTTPGGVALRVRAIHPYPPIDARKVRWWRTRLEDLPGPRDGDALRILAGDFNATLDHDAFREVLDRGYTDAADAVGAGLQTTWPARGRGPSVAIDHVLVPDAVGVRRVLVREVPGSDHRAVIAELVLPRAAS
jgi:endonuclease/exonuclease/phosphatase family metal-dependent hydrolase